MMVPTTQSMCSDFSIPFALSRTHQSFRLFELPDDLADLITSSSSLRLHLKSATETSTNNGSTSQLTPNTKSSEYVHLCSEELSNSWSVRQVSTSNEVYVVQPRMASRELSTDDSTVTGGVDPEAVALTAIAKIDSMLELLPVVVDVEAHLRKLLPFYDKEQLVRLFENEDSTSPLVNEDMDQYVALASQIPAPDVLIWRAWRQLCVSRCPGSRANPRIQHFIPDLQLLKSAWSSALVAYNIRSSGKGFMKQADFEDDGDGVIELLPVKIALWQHLRLMEDSILDRTKATTWVVRNLWLCMWEHSTNGHEMTYSRAMLEDMWRNALPQEYQDGASIDKLEAGTYDLCMEHGEEMIRWTGRSEAITAAPPTTTKPGKRKWHEKFRDSRNAKT